MTTDLDAACIAYVRAKDAASEYAMTMPAQTPAPDRFAAQDASDAALERLIEVAESHGRALITETTDKT